MINLNSLVNQKIKVTKFLFLFSIVVLLPKIFWEKFILTVTFQYNLFLLLRNYAKMCLRLRGQLLYCSEFVSSIKLLVWCATPFLSGKLSVILRLVFDKIVKRLLQFGNILMLVKFQNDQFRQAQKLLRAATVCQLFYHWKLWVFPSYDHQSILATNSNRRTCWWDSIDSNGGARCSVLWQLRWRLLITFINFLSGATNVCNFIAYFTVFFCSSDMPWWWVLLLEMHWNCTSLVFYDEKLDLKIICLIQISDYILNLLEGGLAFWTPISKL